jgi:hypothetical protein
MQQYHHSHQWASLAQSNQSPFDLKQLKVPYHFRIARRSEWSVSCQSVLFPTSIERPSTSTSSLVS